MVQLYSYPAGPGDFFWLRFGDHEVHNFIIDGGDSRCKIKFKELLSEIKQHGEQVDALLLTHFDSDHIMGMLRGLQISYDEGGLPPIARIYMNTGRGIISHQNNGQWDNVYLPEDDIKVDAHTTLCSVTDQIKLVELFDKMGIKQALCNYISTDTNKIEFGGCVCKIISPEPNNLMDIVKTKWMNEKEYLTSIECAQKVIKQQSFSDLINCELPPEDHNISNNASIAFIFEYDDVKIAFLGDATPSICLRGLKHMGVCPSKPCKVDLVKISHHGSRRNYSDDLYMALPTSNYLLSTDGRGGRLPDKIILAKLLQITESKPIFLYCNYNLWEKAEYYQYFTDEDNIKYGDRLTKIYLNARSSHIKIKDGFELNATR